MATAVTSLTHCVVLRNVSWPTYVALTEDLAECSSPRLTYDRGTLEIMTPSTDHERVNRRLHTFVETVCVAWKLRVDNVGSNTLRREDLQRGFEPDTCFYIHHASHVFGKERIDLEQDPPPDLVIEVEVTNTAIDKLALYSAVGVPEVWRWDGTSVIILALQEGRYRRVEDSRAIPGLRASVVSEFARASRAEDFSAWLMSVQEWARANRPGG